MVRREKPYKYFFPVMVKWSNQGDFLFGFQSGSFDNFSVSAWNGDREVVGSVSVPFYSGKALPLMFATRRLIRRANEWISAII